jgi:HK97 family phage major capsid protein
MNPLEEVRKKRAALVEETQALLREMDEFASLERDKFIEEFDEKAWTEKEERSDAILIRLEAIKVEDEPLAAREATLTEAYERTEAARKGSPTVITHRERPSEVRDVASLSDTECRAAAKTLIEEERAFASDAHREAVTALVERGEHSSHNARRVLITGSPVYARAWMKSMTGKAHLMTGEEAEALERGRDIITPEERAGMTSGTGSTGGYAVPIMIDPTFIITGTGSINPFRRLAEVKQIGPAQTGWNGVTVAQVTASWTAETVSAPDNTPTLIQPNIPVYMAELFIPFSYQADQDIADLTGDIAMLFADSKDNLEATAHATGSGSSQPTGVVTAVTAVTNSRVSPQTGGTFGLTDLFSVHSALPPRFRSAASREAFVSSITVMDQVRQLAMAQNSANSVWTDINNDDPPQLFSDPYVEASSMSTSLTTGQNVLLYGDFRRYVIVDRIGFNTEFIPNLFDTSTGRPTGQRGVFSYWRTGANTVDANAFRILKL